MLPNCWRRYPFGIPWTQSLYILLYVIVMLACHYSCITFPSISRILTTAYSRAKQFKPNMFSRGQQRPENVTYGWNFIVNFVFVFFIFILFLFGFVDTPIYEEDFKFRSSPRAEKVYRAVYFGSHSSLSACTFTCQIIENDMRRHFIAFHDFTVFSLRVFIWKWKENVELGENKIKENSWNEQQGTSK
jgi:hypothetical protein